MNAGNLINSAFRLINVLASGEVPSASEQSDALTILALMLDSWQAERLTIFTILRDGSTTSPHLFPFVVGQQTYTLGPGGNFNIARPAKIERMSIEWLANPAQPLELPLEMVNEQRWQTVPVKAITSTLPTVVYDDGNYPLRNLAFWCTPTVVSNVVIYYWQALSQFPDLVTDVEFPPGYFKALRYNLAVDLAAEFGRPISPEVAAQALSSKSIIVSAPGTTWTLKLLDGPDSAGNTTTILGGTTPLTMTAGALQVTWPLQFSKGLQVITSGTAGEVDIEWS